MYIVSGLTRIKTILAISTIFISLIIVACNRHGAGDGDGMPVTVVKAQQHAVPVNLEYIGQIDSISQVEIRARVEGFLQELGFEEGKDVTKDQMLFVIDPRPFEAALGAARGQLLDAQANAEYFSVEEQRMAILLEQHSVSREQYDQTLAQKKQADAQVEIYRANVVTARLNLGYATMVSPIDGRIGEHYVDIGNLVGGGGEQTMLATVVQLNPIYTLFSPSERDYLQIIEHSADGSLDVTVSLASDPSVSLSGRLDFVNNQVELGTGTVLLRAVIPNKDEILLPGMYVNVILHLGEDDHAILVSSVAVIEGQGEEYVYVVGDDDTISQRTVVSQGIYEQNGQQMSVVSSGLKPGERVVVTRLTRMMPGLKVSPTEQTDKQITDDQQQTAPAEQRQ